ncbi:hypothetical protein VTI74DRAFT_1238 [Chaetomium olivicolor]
MMRSSATLGCLPDTLGAGFDSIDFVPVDILADVFVDLATAATKAATNDPEAARDGEEQHADAHAAAVFNLRNPHPVPWATLLPAVTDALAAAPGSTTTTTATREIAAEEGDLEAAARRLPALKLLGFFQDLWSTARTALAAPMAIERALAASPALGALGPVEPGWMRKWVAEWMAVWS